MKEAAKAEEMQKTFKDTPKKRCATAAGLDKPCKQTQRNDATQPDSNTPEKLRNRNAAAVDAASNYVGKLDGRAQALMHRKKHIKKAREEHFDVNAKAVDVIEEDINKAREDVKKVNQKVMDIIEQKKVFMYTQAQGVIAIANAVTDSNCSLNLRHMMDEIGHDPQTMFENKKCKLRLLVQRNQKIWQVVDAQSCSLVQCTVPVWYHSQMPLLCTEILLWLGCAGYSKEALQRAKTIIRGYEQTHVERRENAHIAVHGLGMPTCVGVGAGRG